MAPVTKAFVYPFAILSLPPLEPSRDADCKRAEPQRESERQQNDSLHLPSFLVNLNQLNGSQLITNTIIHHGGANVKGFPLISTYPSPAPLSIVRSPRVS